MFKKKKCSNCNKKLKEKDNFCSSCGTNILKKKKNNYGMLGKTDSIDPIEKKMNEFSKSLLGGGISGGILNKMLGNVMKMLEGEMRKQQNNLQNNPNPNIKKNFQLFINGKPIKINHDLSPKTQIPKKEDKQIISKSFSEKTRKKFINLPKINPKTEVRRLSDSVIYEIKIPGVKNLEDISFKKLENSIEVKAITKDKAYSKSIPISLPILHYELSKGKLILELGEN